MKKSLQEELANKRMKEIQDLNKQIDFNDLTYRYKGKNDLKTFIGFKGPLCSLIHQNIKEGYITLEKAKEEQKTFKLERNKIVIGSEKPEDQKNAIKILKHFTNHDKKLSNYLIIILELYLNLNTKQNMEKDWKY